MLFPRNLKSFNSILKLRRKTLSNFNKFGRIISVHSESDLNNFCESYSTGNEEANKLTRESKDPIVQKYQNLFRPTADNIESADNVYLTNFGSIRMDSDNSPLINDSKDNMITENMTSTVDKPNFVDQVYFGNSLDNEYSNIQNEYGEGVVSDLVNRDELNFLDSQFFPKTEKVVKNDENEGNSVSNLESSSIKFSSETLSHIDKQYIYNAKEYNSYQIDDDIDKVYNFEESFMDFDINKNSKLDFSQSKECSHVSNSIKKDLNISTQQNLQSLEERLESLPKLMPKRKHFKKIIDSGYSSDDKINNPVPVSKEEINENSLKFDPNLKDNQQREKIPKFESKKKNNPPKPPETAYEFVIGNRNNRQSTENAFTDGDDISGSCDRVIRFKKILSFIPSYNDALRYDIVKTLFHDVIYNKNEIVAINKPYGLSIHGGGNSKNCIYSIIDLIPDLAKRLNVPNMHPVHRLDRNTSGVLLFATTSVMADHLKKLFKQRLVEKSYLAITKTIPNPLTGVIDIPIAEGHVDNINRMVLFPDVDGLRAKNVISKKAVTRYKVLSHNVNASLVELEPATGIKHQLRVHLGFGLSCPVLGDHKYSHLRKMAPQRLPGDTMECLGVKQSRVRDLPMYLHSWKFILPAYLRYPLRLDSDGRAIEDMQSIRDNPIKIKGTLPKYFKLTAKYLKLTNKNNFTHDMKIGLILDDKEDW